MNCQEALDLLYDIIDKEASEIDTAEFTQHIEHCQDCLRVYNLEKSVNDLLHAKIQAQSSDGGSHRVEGLRVKILTQLDEIDRSRKKHGGTSFFRPVTRTLVAAASLVVLIGFGIIGAQFFRHQDRYIPLERAHWHVSEHLADYSSRQASASLISAIQHDYSYEVLPRVSGYELLGGKLETVEGVSMHHLVYESEGKLVSVFIIPADDFDIPVDLSKSGVLVGDVQFFDHNCRGCRLVYHKTDSIVIVTATTDRTVDLLQFIPGQSSI